MNNPTGRALLIIMDGWGLAVDPSVSAIDAAHTPFYDYIRVHYPTCRLQASGEAVGLPAGQMGNSEVGHLNLGAGRVVYQELERITHALTDGTLAANPAWLKLMDYCRNGHPLHLMGLVSDGGVHSHLNHLKGLLKHCHQAGLQQVFIHAFTDGRDTDPQGGMHYLTELEQYVAELGTGRVASLCGRYYAMDRDKRWERTQKAYDLLVHGKGAHHSSASDALSASYAAGVTDEFVAPSVIGSQPITLQPSDAVLFFNFRTDRGRQLTRVLTQPPQSDYAMLPIPLRFVTLTRYDESFQGVDIIFENENLTDTLGQVVADHGLSQIRIAETEKYPHVTFFFSGGREEPFPGEERILCPSPKVATYDLAPEMSAAAIRDAIIPKLREQAAHFICLNFANPDMVGHTGVWQAAVTACETVDACTQAVAEAARQAGYYTLILADHGNADKMRNPDGSPHTAHTTALVPCTLIPPASDTRVYSLHDGKLGDVAPTLLHLMGLKAPFVMSGSVFVEK